MFVSYDFYDFGAVEEHFVLKIRSANSYNYDFREAVIDGDSPQEPSTRFRVQSLVVGTLIVGNDAWQIKSARRGKIHYNNTKTNP